MSNMCILIDAQQQARVVPMPDADKLEGVYVPALCGPGFGAGWTFRRFNRYHGPIVPTFVEEQR